MLIQQIFDWFVPRELVNHPLERQARRAVVFGLAMVFWAPVFVPIYAWMGSPRGASMIGLAAVAPIHGAVPAAATSRAPSAVESGATAVASGAAVEGAAAWPSVVAR